MHASRRALQGGREGLTGWDGGAPVAGWEGGVLVEGGAPVAGWEGGGPVAGREKGLQ